MEKIELHPFCPKKPTSKKIKGTFVAYFFYRKSYVIFYGTRCFRLPADRQVSRNFSFILMMIELFLIEAHVLYEKP
jgi:hypothetical protein